MLTNQQLLCLPVATLRLMIGYDHDDSRWSAWIWSTSRGFLLPAVHGGSADDVFGQLARELPWPAERWFVGLEVDGERYYVLYPDCDECQGSGTEVLFHVRRDCAGCDGRGWDTEQAGKAVMA